MWRTIIFYLTKLILILSPVKAHHRERLPEGACIVCPNHAALRDPFCVAMAVGNQEFLHYMAKSNYYDKPVVGRFIRSVGAFRVDPEKGYLSAIREAMQFLKNGEKVCIFPEGTRVAPGATSTFKTGGARFAARQKAKVLPIAVNSGEFWPKNALEKTPGKIIVSIGPAIDTQGRDFNEVNYLASTWIEEEVRRIGNPRFYDASLS